MVLNVAAAEQLFDYDVVDSQNNKIGTVDNIWEDSSTAEPAFIGAKTGWLGSRIYVIPVEGAKVDAVNRAVRVAYNEDRIKNAPHLSADADLTPDEENIIYQYYGLHSGTEAGHADTGIDHDVALAVTGTPDGNAAEGIAERGGEQNQELVGQQDTTLPLAEEGINVEKHMVEAGRVRLRKIVRTEHVSIPVELRREHVEIERVAVTGGTVSDDAFTETEISIPLMREEAIATKTAFVAGEVRIHKTADTETRTVERDLREVDVQIDKSGADLTDERDVNDVNRSAKR